MFTEDQKYRHLQRDGILTNL